MSKSILIIGAGIAGLATGCYAQMNGYQTRIFGLHDKPGGLCTSWKRKGYTFDGCIHHLAGAGSSTELHRMWQELGSVQGRKMLFPEDLVQVEGPGGKVLTVYTDLDRLEQHMKEIALADTRTIEEYTRAARRFACFDFFALLGGGSGAMLKALPYLPTLIKWMRITLGDYAQRFSDPFLRAAFPWIQYDFPNIPAGLNLDFLAGCHNKALGWPEGGSLGFSRAIERRYLELGGQVHYKSRVAKVLVEGDRAVGVRLADGSEHRADVVISAADGRATIFDLLEGKYASDLIRRYYASAPAHQEMCVHVSLGVARDLSHEPHALTILLEQPVTLAGQTCERLDVENYAFDPTLAPAGKTALKVLLDSSYDYWKELRADPERYRAEKERLAEQVIGLLEARFPGIREQIEVVDVATPLTVERYTGNYLGYQAWGIPNVSPLGSLKGLSTTLPGLTGFYMVGHWAGATIGVSTVAAAGRKLVQRLCKADGRRFVATPQR